MFDSNELVLPPLDGSLTIAQALDFHWNHNPTRPIYAFSDGNSQEVTEISFLEFGRACHRAAHVLRPGRSGEDNKVVAFIAHADTIVYQAVVVGLITAGLVPFAISPRITPAAIIHLLKNTSCHRLVATQVTLRALLDDVKSELNTNNPKYELTIDEMPSLDELYPKLGKEALQDPFQLYTPYVVPSPNDIALYLHSSGSTGFPKAIPQTHMIMAHWAASPPVVALREHQPRLAAMHLPPFHTLGVFLHILDPLFAVTSISVYPPVVKSKDSLPMMPTPDNILDHTRRTKSNAMMTIPALLQVWAQSKEAVKLLSSLEFVGYSGGSVAPKLGDFMVASGVKLNPGYGGTEFGAPTYLPRNGCKDDWAYMEFGDRLKVRWIPQGDGTYECQFLTSETHRLPIENLPDVKGYATSDLWERHPTKDNLWKIVGRIDDVLIHSSGEKTVPAPIEDVVMSSPYIMGTIVFGRERDQPGILIEPKTQYAIDVEDEVQLANFRNKIWSVIEEANAVAPAFSRIFKEMILISSKDKPLPRTGKGTVMRKLALKAYEGEIDSIYAAVESSAKVESVIPPRTWTKCDLRIWLLEQAADIHSGRKFWPSRDLFEQGFDSLSATIIRRRIIGALKSSKDAAVLKAAEEITQNAVYNHPTIDALTAFITNLVMDPEGDAELDSDRKTLIEEMIKKYSTGLDTPIPHASGSSHSVVVLLTGSTGNLGSQILASLLKYRNVERVYALNRASAASTSIINRHRERFQDKALDVDLLNSTKLVFVEGDAAQENLGLSKDTYDELRQSVTIIIHNAWKLDFNLSLSSFEPNVRGTRNLIDLARSSARASSLRFLFTSSVASAQSWDKAKGPFPEEIITDAAVAVGNGYGESKYVSERILAQSGLQVSSFRIGQISGDQLNGAWATSDWLPILVKSSVALRALPSATGVVSWLPMDGVSKAILDTAFSSHQPPIALNLVHPKPIEWNTVINYIGEALHQERSEQVLPVVSFQEWYALLEKRAKSASDADIQKIPAIKLLEFLRGVANADVATDNESGGLSSFATQKAQYVSPTMRDLPPLEARDVQRWVQYWNKSGLFD